MKTLLLLLAITVIAGSAVAQSQIQTDWSGGDGGGTPVTDWGDGFAAQSDLAWLSRPGQLALTPTELTTPVERVIDDSAYVAFGLETGDFNGDGYQDVVVAFDVSGILRVWLNNGQSPPRWLAREVDYDVPKIDAVWPADLDGDGDLDLAGTVVEPHNRVYWWRNEDGLGGSWTRHDVDTSFKTAFEMHAQDLNFDGRTDLLSASYDDSTVVWWENQPPVDPDDPPTWLRHEIADEFYGGHSLRAADFDMDGDWDFVGASGMLDEVAVWLNTGGDPVQYVKVTLATDFTAGRSVRAADIDGDGRVDVVGTCWYSDVRWWRNTGNDPSTWPQQVIDGTFTGGHHINVADLNGDGNLDVFGAAVTDGEISWWENDGAQPINWTQHVVTSAFTSTVQTCAADLDHDGALDILASSMYFGSFNWWKISAPEAGSGYLESSVLDLGRDQVGLSANWDAAVPTGTSLVVRTRSADDAGDLGAWSEPLVNGGTLPQPLDRFLQYRVEMSISSGAVSPVLREIEFEPTLSPVSDDQTPALQGCLEAWPNPFNPRVTFSFTLAEAAHVRLGVYDLRGRCVSVIADETQVAGSHTFSWDARCDVGAEFPSGVYFARLETEGKPQTRKILLLR